ncbi:uncharacterized protein Z519_04651 [Cladophialophora bantiana CBS 173.52]|uniref:NWD NACHT-NTPase N-terminal domain-containing protein n=1 Tax=Cladophialophora bantiana (strain ATCC 10958 / CBS 173.52 / CDC B-1940 / NIH 8579) TaxID=1442370 RepID=A0A0D2ID42_CLAB1|nr:uncharacterized protein Z519_04651 [Cladophialophora bantiana CBS 173.52]KIW94674.1 hypothetical protein Z519_04651 [Cladophialophora bantiana CBS 173.52]
MDNPTKLSLGERLKARFKPNRPAKQQRTDLARLTPTVDKPPNILSGAAVDKTQKRNLWQEAFDALQKDERMSVVLAEFGQFIISSTTGQSLQNAQAQGASSKTIDVPISDEAWRDNLTQQAASCRDRMAINAQRDERAANTLDGIVTANDCLTVFTSFEPHAAMAWAGISVTLPVMQPQRALLTDSG